ncbi:MAG: NUDIX hydrolase [bacterium]
MVKKYETVSSEVIFRNPYWNYRFDEYILPNSKKGEYHFVDSRGACIVIPILGNNTFVMVRQYRYLNHRFSIEFPGGGLAKEKRIEDNASDELHEEAGYLAKKIELIGKFNPYNGVTNEICSVFVASDLLKSETCPDETEEFEILTLKEEEIIKKISSNEIWDGMTLASWSLFNFSEIKKGLNL